MVHSKRPCGKWLWGSSDMHVGDRSFDVPVPHVYSPAHGVAGRGLSEEFKEELQGSKVQ